MTRFAIVVAVSFVFVGLWVHGSSSAQTGQGRRGNAPPPPATTQQQQQQEQAQPRAQQQAQQPQQPMRQRQRGSDRDGVTVTVNNIPAFMQAGRSYVFQPVGGEEFSGRVVALDATGWVQVQLRPGPDIGPLAEWFNLANMTSIKAMN